jgi:2-amino-4-hydroxy-6-hydroxymethyldihydropteridine diphosphokinase
MSEDLRPAYVIGLGANVGDRRGTLRAAVLTLASVGRVLALSDLYETAPVGPPQPDYLNAALLLETPLGPRAVLTKLLEVEQAHGRARRERWGPRTLDLDLLHAAGLVVDEPDLVLPHPELRRRAFALSPLLDLLPDACDPRSGDRYRAWLDLLDPASIHRLETSTAWDPRLSADPLQAGRNGLDG